MHTEKVTSRPIDFLKLSFSINIFRAMDAYLLGDLGRWRRWQIQILDWTNETHSILVHLVSGLETPAPSLLHSKWETCKKMLRENCQIILSWCKNVPVTQTGSEISGPCFTTFCESVSKQDAHTDQSSLGHIGGQTADQGPVVCRRVPEGEHSTLKEQFSWYNHHFCRKKNGNEIIGSSSFLLSVCINVILLVLNH